MGPWRLWTAHLLAAAWFGYGVLQLRALWAGDPDADIMLVTSGAVAVPVFYLSIGAGRRLDPLLRGLTDAAVLVGGPDSLARLRADLLAVARRDSLIGAMTCVALMLMGFLVGNILGPWMAAGIDPIRSDERGLLIGLFEVWEFAAMVAVLMLAGTLAGWLLGGLAALARLRDLALRHGVGISPQPGHPDRLGGLQLLLRFLVRFSALSLLPVLWLSAWLLLTAVQPWLVQFGHWRVAFFPLLVLALIFVWRGLLTPLRAMDDLVKEQLHQARSRPPSAFRRQLEESAGRVRRRIRPWPPALLAGLTLAFGSALASWFLLPAELNGLSRPWLFVLGGYPS